MAQCSQAYGNKSFNLIGNYLQRCLVIDMLLMIVSVVLNIYSHAILTTIGIKPETAKISSELLIVMIPSNIAFILYDILKQYLAACEIFTPVMWV